jgi:energy-coupling factor transporter ATP-binding protein EcfA2
VLDDLSLEIAAGSVTGLVDPSGSGQSTLIRAIVGVQIVEGREVVVLGSLAGSLPWGNHVSPTAPFFSKADPPGEPPGSPLDPCPLTGERRAL